jgi:hypothetical protein
MTKGAYVTATDTNPLPLALLKMAAQHQLVPGSGSLTTAYLDILAPGKGTGLGAEVGWDLLRDCDVLVAADCLYNKALSLELAKCCLFVLGQTGLNKTVLVADSQGFHRADFLNALSEGWKSLEKSPLRPEMPPDVELVKMVDVCGSGLLLEGDLTYNITVALLTIRAGPPIPT